MAKAFDKAKTNTEKKNSKKWYIINTKEYRYPIWALPIIPFCWMYDKITKWLYNRRKWTDEKAIKVLDKALVKILKWDFKEQFFYCRIHTFGGGALFHHVPLFYRPWAKKFDYDLKEFLIEKYETADYIKTIEQEDTFDYYLEFREKK